MIAEIRQLLLTPCKENFKKLLSLVKDLEPDAMEVSYIIDHLKCGKDGKWCVSDFRSTYLRSVFHPILAQGKLTIDPAFEEGVLIHKVNAHCLVSHPLDVEIDHSKQLVIVTNEHPTESIEFVGEILGWHVLSAAQQHVVLSVDPYDVGPFAAGENKI